ncbi:DUF6963 family protein [Paenalcaligenes suwonensis]|uniref:DUF6963 family protein n=1 Tax=Paenalcaligenes suwonensis TaxID=1202713 RepID=UPI00140C7683|nr:hypothetical protein [Paenalcaligenes suwonensis]NHC60063.1 hypothetical protein [Paenalcaligenes suwonensis]
MTIGIAVTGKHAVVHALRVLRCTEILGSGAIGGFAVLAVMAEDGTVHYSQTQDGGSHALDVDPAWLQCERAALISSGPHRPEPLQQFLPSLPGVALMTGHRLPNRPTPQGLPVNQLALQALQRSRSAEQAVQDTVTAYPEYDAGLMAVTVDGQIAYANTARVTRRPDVHHGEQQHPDRHVAVMLNSIYFAPHLAPHIATLLCDVAWPEPMPTSQTGAMLLTVPDQCPILPAAHDQIVVNPITATVQCIYTADPFVQHAEGRCVAIQGGCAAVTTDGQVLGSCLHDLLGHKQGDHLQRLLPQHPPLSLIIGAHV